MGALPQPTLTRMDAAVGRCAYRQQDGHRLGPFIEGPMMSDKSPRSTSSKKSGQSLKEKRAAKRSKADQASQTEAVLHPKKR